MLAYKGFNADFTCRGFRFEVGETYTVAGEIVACRNGFHACENPFDVWSYYPVVADDGSMARYAEVEMSGATAKDGDKIAAAEITINAELRLPEFVKRAVAAIVSATKGKGDNHSGDSARIGSSGDSARIGSSGYSARIGSSCDYARIGSSGDSAQIGSSGDSAQIGSSGDSARIGSSGYSARIGSSGDYAQIGSSGDSARVNAEGANAVIACAGSAIVKAGPGGAICIPYHDGTRTRFAVGYVGEDGIEAGKWYSAEGGKLKEVA